MLILICPNRCLTLSSTLVGWEGKGAKGKVFWGHGTLHPKVTK